MGIKFANTLTPGGSSFPIVNQEDVKGGFHSVANEIELADLLTNNRISVGTFVKVRDLDKVYEYTASGWVETNFGGLNIPIVTQNLLDKSASKPAEYIQITTPNDLDGKITNNTATTVNGTYVDILFKAVRQLQTEVTKLKNTYYYGICSQTQGNTSSSNIVLDIDEEEKEPLWALDPEDLEELDDNSILIDSNCSLTPKTNWTYNSTTNYISITNSVSTKQITDYDIASAVTPKVLFYSCIEPKTNWEFHINFPTIGTLKLEDLVSNQKINILFIVSRTVTTTDGSYNKNFYWISITNSSGDIILQTYLDTSFNQLESEPDLESVEMFSNISMSNINLYKLDFYTKSQSFSNQSDIISYKPDVSDFIFQPAHITIRGVDSYELLTKITNKLYNYELVWCSDSDNGGLYIKADNQLIALNSSNISLKTTTLTISNLAPSLEIGETFTNNITTNNIYGTITYTSSNTKVATIDKNGLITAISEGVSIITVTIAATSSYTEGEGTFTITVTAPEQTSWEFGASFPIEFISDTLIEFPFKF